MNLDSDSSAAPQGPMVPVRLYSTDEYTLPAASLPDSMQSVVEEACLTLLERSEGRLIVTGPSASGKSSLVSQIIGNLSYYAEVLPNEPEFLAIHLTRPDARYIASLQGSLDRYIDFVSDKMVVPEERIVVVTDDVDSAAMLHDLKTSARIILEASEETADRIVFTQSSGTGNSWSSWSFFTTRGLHATREELMDFITESAREITAREHGVSLKKKHVAVALRVLASKLGQDNIFRPAGEEDMSEEPLLIVPPAVVGQIVRRASAIMAVNQEDESGFALTIGPATEAYLSLAAQFLASETTHVVGDMSEMPPEFAESVAQALGLQQPGSIAPATDSGDATFKAPRSLGKRLKSSIFGQDEAVEAVAESLAIAAAGLNDPGKPIRSFMFMGPTGVGKTQLALEIAKEAQRDPMHVIRVDMSEYNTEGSSKGLFGSSPGYIGYDPAGGRLTREVAEHPRSLIILDEVEKAHSSVWDAFLQVLDAGRMTSGGGVEVDFTNTIVVMTSNIGAESIGKPSLGFGATAPTRADKMAAAQRSLKEFMRLEFINRIDDIVLFEKIDRSVARRIAQAEIMKIATRANATGSKLAKPNKDILDRILDLSNFELYGAREIQRVVSRKVSSPLANAMLKRKGKDFAFKLNDDQIDIVANV